MRLAERRDKVAMEVARQLSRYFVRSLSYLLVVTHLDMFILGLRGPPPAHMSVAEWRDEVALEEARQLSLALEASRREAHGLPSEDLIEVNRRPFPIWLTPPFSPSGDASRKASKYGLPLEDGGQGSGIASCRLSAAGRHVDTFRDAAALFECTPRRRRSGSTRRRLPRRNTAILEPALSTQIGTICRLSDC